MKDSQFYRLSNTETVRRNLRQRSVRSALLMTSGSVAELLIRLVSIAVLARLLAPEDFGLVAMVTAITALLDAWRDLGLNAVTIQRENVTQEQVANLFWINVTGGIVFAVGLCAAAPMIASFYRDSRLVEIVLALSLVYVWAGLSVQHEALMNRQMRLGELSFIRIGASAISTVLAIALAIYESSYWALVWREVLRSMLIALGVWKFCPWVPSTPRRNVGTKALLKFGRDLSFTNIAAAVIFNVDRVLIGRFFGPEVVGLYRQAQQLVMAPVEQLNGPVMSVAQPGLSMLQSAPDRYGRYYVRIVFVVALVTVPLGLFIAVYAEEITALLLGPKWKDSAPFIAIFGVVAALRPVMSTASAVVISRGLGRRYFGLSILHGVTLVALMLVGLRWGADGVAFAQIAATGVLMLPMLYFSFAQTPITLAMFWRALRPSVISGVFMLGALIAFRLTFHWGAAWSAILVGMSVAAAAYAAALFAQRSGREQLFSLAMDVKATLAR